MARRHLHNALSQKKKHIDAELKASLSKSVKMMKLRQEQILVQHNVSWVEMWDSQNMGYSYHDKQSGRVVHVKPKLYVMNADGSNQKRLTFKGRYNTSPDWSPKGDKIAFCARDERNAYDIFTVDMGGFIEREVPIEDQSAKQVTEHGKSPVEKKKNTFCRNGLLHVWHKTSEIKSEACKDQSHACG